MRTAGQERLGFYPLWPQMVELIGHHLIWPHEGKTLLFDPCAGEGDAIQQVRDMHGAARTIVYAIDLSEKRGAGIAKRFIQPDDQVIQGVSCTVVEFPKSKGMGRLGAHLLLFNPPYDDDKEFGRFSFRAMHFLMGEKQRALAPGGLFISVLPEHDTVRHLKQYLSLFTQCAAFRLPEPYYSKYHQVVFMGITRPVRAHIDADDIIAWERYFDAGVPTLGEPTPDEWEMPRWGLANPHYPLGSLSFDQHPNRMKNPVFNIFDTVDTVETASMLHNRAFVDQLFGAPRPPISVIRPMGAGHLALAAAGGLFNHMVLDMRPEGGDVVGIRGSAIKVLEKRDSYTTDDGVDITVAQERVQTSVYAINLKTGEVTLYEVSKAPQPDTKIEQFDERKWAKSGNGPELV